MLPAKTIEAIEKCLSERHSCEVKIEKGAYVVVELSRKVKSKEDK